MNARLAKILTTNEYDGRVIYWSPSDASNRADDGAIIQAPSP